MTREEFLEEVETLADILVTDVYHEDLRWSAFFRESKILADKLFPMSDPSAKV